MTDGRRVAAIDAAATLVLATVTTVGFTSWYSRALFDRDAFQAQYRTGIYQYRILGRELVLLVERVIGNPLADWVPPAAQASLPGNLLSALIVVNMTALLASAVLLHRLLASAGLGDTGRALAFVSLMTILAGSTYVVTPYDLVGVLLLLLLLGASQARPPFDLLMPVFAVLGVANRETQFLALAGLWAWWWTTDRSRSRTFALTVVSTFAAFATFVALRVSGPGEDGPVTLWSALTLAGNLGRPTGAIGVLVIVAVLAWWWTTCGLVGLGTDPGSQPVRRLFWVLSIPYLLFAGLTGYWFEIRLLIPLLTVDCWVRASARPVAERRRPEIVAR